MNHFKFYIENTFEDKFVSKDFDDRGVTSLLNNHNNPALATKALVHLQDDKLQIYFVAYDVKAITDIAADKAITHADGCSDETYLIRIDVPDDLRKVKGEISEFMDMHFMTKDTDYFPLDSQLSNTRQLVADMAAVGNNSKKLNAHSIASVLVDWCMHDYAGFAEAAKRLQRFKRDYREHGVLNSFTSNVDVSTNTMTLNFTVGTAQIAEFDDATKRTARDLAGEWFLDEKNAAIRDMLREPQMKMIYGSQLGKSSIINAFGDYAFPCKNTFAYTQKSAPWTRTTWTLKPKMILFHEVSMSWLWVRLNGWDSSMTVYTSKKPNAYDFIEFKGVKSDVDVTLHESDERFKTRKQFNETNKETWYALASKDYVQQEGPTAKYFCSGLIDALAVAISARRNGSDHKMSAVQIIERLQALRMYTSKSHLHIFGGSQHFYDLPIFDQLQVLSCLLNTKIVLRDGDAKTVDTITCESKFFMYVENHSTVTGPWLALSTIVDLWMHTHTLDDGQNAHTSFNPIFKIECSYNNKTDNAGDKENAGGEAENGGSEPIVVAANANNDDAQHSADAGDGPGTGAEEQAQNVGVKAEPADAELFDEAQKKIPKINDVYKLKKGGKMYMLLANQSDNKWQAHPVTANGDGAYTKKGQSRVNIALTPERYEFVEHTQGLNNVVKELKAVSTPVPAPKIAGQKKKSPKGKKKQTTNPIPKPAALPAGAGVKVKRPDLYKKDEYLSKVLDVRRRVKFQNLFQLIGAGVAAYNFEDKNYDKLLYCGVVDVIKGTNLENAKINIAWTVNGEDHYEAIPHTSKMWTMKQKVGDMTYVLFKIDDSFTKQDFNAYARSAVHDNGYTYDQLMNATFDDESSDEY